MDEEHPLMPLNKLPWGKGLMAGVVNALDVCGIPSLLWGDSVLVAYDKPTALGLSSNSSFPTPKKGTRSALTAKPP